MVKKIIALDIDQFRIGVYGPNYEEIFSSMYSEVKKKYVETLILLWRC